VCFLIDILAFDNHILSNTSQTRLSSERPTRRLRNLRGDIIGSSPIDKNFHSYPSLGTVADSFLQAFGYDLVAVLTIAIALERANDREDFVARLTENGMAEAEAQWLWVVVKGEQQD
jgi:hypothetical protein